MIFVHIAYRVGIEVHVYMPHVEDNHTKEGSDQLQPSDSHMEHDILQNEDISVSAIQETRR